MSKKLWRAMCGKWGDHQSGSCPELRDLSDSGPSAGSVPTNREKLLGEALHKTLIACGVLGVDSAPSGPELLWAAECFFESWEQNDQDQRQERR